MKLLLDGSSLTVDTAYRASAEPSTLSFSPQARRRILSSRRIVEEWIRNGEIVYGVTTGFGEFSNVVIDGRNIERLQENLIVSHAAGTGEPLPEQVVRAMMILRLNALAKGFSGIRLETMEFVRTLFNAGVTPVIPSKGSVGSSGDLVPLAHLVLTLFGKGKVRYRGHITGSRSVLRKLGLRPWKLAAKEGLALVNGTQMMSAFGICAVHEAEELCRIADVTAAMSAEALLGSDTAFNPRIQRVRPHRGQGISAANLRRCMAGSEIRESHRHDPHRVQDAYSLRCIPQVHGAVRDAVAYAHRVLEVEINSATDNPLIFPGGVHLEGGNFHGEPVALALDFMAIALSELANIAERRIERMVNGALSGLPRFLTQNGGLNSGMMIAQYTAASLVSENKVLSHPASTDSIPTSANQEDHNSMGSISAQKLRQVLINARTVIAIELMVASQALDFARQIDGGTGGTLNAGAGTEAAYRHVRRRIPYLDADRVLHDDIQMALEIIRAPEFLAAVESDAGRLQ